MARSPSSPGPEAVVAFGARMSWAGLLRPGDPFALPVRSQRAVVVAARGEPVRRVVGGWSSRYRRFTLNLSSPRVRVRAIPAGAPMPTGVPCLLHWVDRSTLLGVGPGTVCAGDGWPVALWQRFLSEFDARGAGPVAERLHRFQNDPGPNEGPEVVAWRSLVSTVAPDPSRADGLLGSGWLPVAAPLEGAVDRSTCLLSWSPSAERFGSFHAAIASPAGKRRAPDPRGQATYFVEATLARLHGVLANGPDALADATYVRDPMVEELLGALEPQERARIADPRFGPLDRYGAERPTET